MKIAVAVNAFPKVSETFIRSHIISLIKLGHKVTILASSVNPEGVDLEDVREYDLMSRLIVLERPNYSKSRLWRLGYYLRVLPRYVRNPQSFFRILTSKKLGWASFRGKLYLMASPLLPEQAFDVIHCHFGPVGYDMSQLMVANIVRGKLCVSFHGYDLTTRYLKTYSINKLFNRSHSLIANSEFLANKLRGLGAPKNKAKVYPVGLNLERFNTDLKPRSTSETINILSVGRLVEFKGYYQMLKAIDLLNQRVRRKICYAIIGDGPLRKDLEQYASKLGIRSLVNFYGRKNSTAVFQLMQEADIFMLCGVEDSFGQSETQGVVYQEAHVFGLPVLASDLGGAPESVEHGHDGLLSKPGNPQQIAENLKMLIEDEALRKVFGENGRKKVLEKYDQLKITEQMLDDLDKK